jgi:hypothetical protein
MGQRPSLEVVPPGILVSGRWVFPFVIKYSSTLINVNPGGGVSVSVTGEPSVGSLPALIADTS